MTGTARVPEAAFQSQVIALARRLGWRTAHFRPAQNQRGEWRTPVAGDGKGFPDLVLVRERIIFAELKTDTGRLRPDQTAWLDALGAAAGTNVEVHVWRPKDWDAIHATLAKPRNRVTT
jgi:hypothetical protein